MSKYLKFINSIAAAVFAFVVFGMSVAGAQSQEITLNPGQSWSGSVPTASTLSLDGRLVYSRTAGANYALQVSVNGEPVTSALTNKGQTFKFQDGRTFGYKSGNAWLIFYSNDFSANNSTAGGGYQVLTDPGQAYHYSWDISSIAGKAAQMEIVIKNVSPTYPIVGRLTSAGALVFPIKELGNCTSEGDCKKYCDDSNNIAVCADYAEQHGIISKEDVARAKEFADVLRGEGPGKCKDKNSCENYCNGTAHINECVSFAEKHNLIPADQLKEAKQVAAALGTGAQLPGLCTDKKSCEQYCAAPGHIEECLSFAEKAGFVSADEAAQARKVLPLIQSGESPGKCTTKGQCEKYCEAADHAVECVNFAEKVGFVSKEEADMARKTGGKGPGGCKSKDSCDAYCNAPGHQQECFDFATKYNLIPEDKLKEIIDGMSQLRVGLPQLPPEATTCLKDKLGEDFISKISDGSFMPSPQIGENIKSCMADIMPKVKEKINQAMQYATPETKACLDKGLGVGGLDRFLSGGEMKPQDSDIVRKCFESMRESGMKQAREGLSKMPAEMRSCVEEKIGKDAVKKIEEGDSSAATPELGQALQSCAGSAAQMMDKALEQAPPQIRDCIKSKIGDVSKISGPPDIQGLISECMKNFKPEGIPSGAPGGTPGADYRPSGIPEGSAPPSGIMPPAGMTPPSGTIPSGACAAFKAAPSCDYVPENVRDLCKKCQNSTD